MLQMVPASTVTAQKSHFKRAHGEIDLSGDKQEPPRWSQRGPGPQGTSSLVHTRRLSTQTEPDQPVRNVITERRDTEEGTRCRGAEVPRWEE